MSLTEIKEKFAKAEKNAGRSTGSAQLIAVSKVQPDERVHAVLREGHRLFGENVQEAAGKWPKFKEEFPDASVHLIGPLQTNKARQAMELFDAIHTVDRPKLAKTIARLAQELGSCPDLFVQEEADVFIAECRALDLPIQGLMCIPPADEEASLHFALLGKIAARNGLAGLSMGMSGDFERAIALGATHVRVGSAIFGQRAYEL